MTNPLRPLSFSLFLSLCLPLLYSCSTNRRENIRNLTPRSHCIVSRGTFDMGSGSTKFTLARLDLCRNKVISLVERKYFAFKFKEYISLTGGTLEKEVLERVSSQLKIFLTQIPLPLRQIRAVGTQVFREAKNGKSFIQKLSEKLGIEIFLISQREEAILGFKGAEIMGKRNPQNIAVWDIGGGSMQITTKEGSDYSIYEGTLASVSLKNRVLQWMGKKRGSPNPLKRREGEKALHFVETYAREEFSESFLKEIKEKEMIGIGGVHNASLKKQLALERDTPYSRYQVNKAFQKRLYFSDAQLQGRYRETEVTNLALVLGFMKALNLKTVLPLEVDLSLGLLFSEKYW